MIAAIHNSLARKREMLRNDEKGFTLIELLVVVLIIGILTAIAVPVFLTQQNQARDAAAKSDLGVAKVAYISYVTATGNPATTAANLEAHGYQQSAGPGPASIISGDEDSFCISVESETGTVFYITQAASASTTACT